MGRHLILIVHGIGEQKAGETVDAIVGTAVSTMPNAEPVKIQSDKIDLPAKGFSTEGGQTPMFPVHIRRVRPGNEQVDTRDAVFAEVYWADKSPAPKGFFATAFDLLRVILGLGYIAMDNVSNVGSTFAGFFVHAFTWILFVGIAAANAVLLIGVGLLALDLVVTPLEAGAARWLFVAQGVVAIIIGFYLWDYRWTRFYRNVYVHSYLVRLFGGGMLVFGVAIFVAALLNFSGVPLGSGCPALVDVGAQKGLSDGDVAFIERFNCSIPAMLAALGYLWAGAVLLACFIYVLPLLDGVFRLFKGDEWVPLFGDTRVLYPSVCAAMLLFWLTISAAFWFLLLNVIEGLSPQTRITEHKEADIGHVHESVSAVQLILTGQLDVGLSSLPYAAVGTLSVVFAGLVLIGLRKIVIPEERNNTEVKKGIYLANPWRRRVILNVLIKVAFLIGLIISATGMYLSSLETDAIEALKNGSLGWYVTPIHKIELIKPFVPPVLLVVGLLIYNFSSGIAGALGIVRDIVGYSQVRKCELWMDPVCRQEVFVLRNEINDRFDRVLRHLLHHVRPSKLTIISHSLGTVIATRCLEKPRIQKMLKKAGPGKTVLPLRLVTMGSPVTEVYSHHFKRDFKVTIADAKEPPFTDFKWINMFRANDFVGTKVDVLPKCQNLAVGAHGHTGYFTDDRVWTHLWGKAGFTMWHEEATEDSAEGTPQSTEHNLDGEDASRS